MSDPLDLRIDELEVRLSFQDKAIEELRDQLLAQQRLIDELKLENRELMRRMKESGGTAVASLAEETPPPHY